MNGLNSDQFRVSLLVAIHLTLSITATDAAQNSLTTVLNVTLPVMAPLNVSNFTPSTGASDIGATYRPEVFFSRSIMISTLNSNDFFLTDSTGSTVPTTIVPSDDGTYAWLFPNNPMPGASTMTVTVDGTQIRSADGAFLDAANTGSITGSKLTYNFTTVSVAPLANTSLSGVVADPGPDLKPGTKDDVIAGTNGLGSANDLYKLPIAGVMVSIVGTNLSAVTDSLGRFNFPAIPSGDLKLEVDGMTATNAPPGYYFPQMVMDLNILPGVANTVMSAMQGTGTGNSQPGAALPSALGVYLPRVLTSVLKPIPPTGITHIVVDPGAAPDLNQKLCWIMVTALYSNRPNSAACSRISLKNASASSIGVPLAPLEPAGIESHLSSITNY